jgi:hypothetical protein
MIQTLLSYRKPLMALLQATHLPGPPLLHECYLILKECPVIILQFFTNGQGIV